METLNNVLLDWVRENMQAIVEYIRENNLQTERFAQPNDDGMIHWMGQHKGHYLALRGNFEALANLTGEGLLDERVGGKTNFRSYLVTQRGYQAVEKAFDIPSRQSPAPIVVNQISIGDISNSSGFAIGAGATSITDSSAPDESSVFHKRPGNTFWLAFDLMWTQGAILQGAPGHQVGGGLRQCIWHAKNLGLENHANTLSPLKRQADELGDSPLSDDFRTSLFGALSAIITEVGNEAANNQPDFKAREDE